jgi:hypothetical protein
MIKKVLIANRGEIALRIVRACNELGIKTLAVYSQADEQSLHVQLADEAICIGPPPSNQSYLKADRIIAAAEIADVDAIHPGYGFLAENADFAEQCEKCNIKFIGPSSDAIVNFGDKARAREMAVKAKVPVIPGSEGVVNNDKDALAVAKKIGFPVIIKAVAGGGGKGNADLLIMPLPSRKNTPTPATRRKTPSVTARFILRNSWKLRAILKSNSSVTNAVMLSTWANGIAPSNADTRNSSRKHPPLSSMTIPVKKWVAMPSNLRSPLNTKALARSNSSWTETATTTLSR